MKNETEISELGKLLPGVESRIHCVSKADFEEGRSLLKEAARNLHYRVFEIDCAFLITKASLMEYLRDVFGFPDWFGSNWDAVFDLLTGMNWVDAQGYVIILENEEELAR